VARVLGRLRGEEARASGVLVDEITPGRDWAAATAESAM